MGKHKIAVYGSLREGMYNRIGFDSLKTLYSGSISGFIMRSLGSYPYIYPSENKDDSIIVELCEVEDSDYETIRRMEIGAGYAEVPLNINGEVYLLYVYKKDNEHHQLVESGDWVNFVK